MVVVGEGGAPEQFQQQCSRLAKQGVLAFSAEYRLEATHGTSPFECVKDAKSAMRWLRGNAKEFNLNENFLAAGGGSAGGHMAASLGTIKLVEASDDLRLSCFANALVLFNPVIDNSAAGYGFDRFGERYKEISPLHNIYQGLPPTLILLGSDDDCLPVDSVVSYCAAMKLNADRCEYVVYEGQKHGFFNYGNGQNRFYDLTMLEAESFLKSLSFF